MAGREVENRAGYRSASALLLFFVLERMPTSISLRAWSSILSALTASKPPSLDSRWILQR